MANLVFKLGALGARKLGEHEECIVVLRFGLSFVFPDVLVDTLFGMLPMQLEEQMADIGRKLDLLLGEAQLTSMQLLRDAFIAFDTGNYSGACQLFHEVRKNATRAFNQSDNIEAWVTTTQLKITATFLTKSFESDRMVLFTDLTPNRRLEIARTVKGYIDDLIAKADSLKKDTVEKVKRASFQQKARTKEAKEKLKGIDDKINPVLRATYPVLSHGLGLTDPNRRIRAFSNDEFNFDVLPKYIPEGKLNHVSVMVAKKPELIIGMHRRLDFTYESLDLIEGQVRKPSCIFYMCSHFIFILLFPGFDLDPERRESPAAVQAIFGGAPDDQGDAAGAGDGVPRRRRGQVAADHARHAQRAVGGGPAADHGPGPGHRRGQVERQRRCSRQSPR